MDSRDETDGARPAADANGTDEGGSACADRPATGIGPLAGSVCAAARRRARSRPPKSLSGRRRHRRRRPDGGGGSQGRRAHPRGPPSLPADAPPQLVEAGSELRLEPVAGRPVVVGADELIGRVLLLDDPVLAVVGVPIAPAVAE